MNLLGKIEVEVANSKRAAQVARKERICEQTHCRRLKDYGGLRLDQAKRLKVLERENSRLKRQMAELPLEFVARELRKSLARPGTETLFIEPGSPGKTVAVKALMASCGMHTSMEKFSVH